MGRFFCLKKIGEDVIIIITDEVIRTPKSGHEIKTVPTFFVCGKI